MSYPRARSRNNGQKGSPTPAATDDDNIFSAESKLTKENGELKLEIEKLKGALSFSQSELDQVHQKLENAATANSNSSIREEELRLKVEYLELEVQSNRIRTKDGDVAVDDIKILKDEVDRLQKVNAKIESKYDQLNRINALQDEEIKDQESQINELKKVEASVSGGSQSVDREKEIAELKSTLAMTKTELAKFTSATNLIEGEKNVKIDAEDSKEGDQMGIADGVVIPVAHEALQKKLESAEMELEEARKRLESQNDRVKKFKEANASLREELLCRDEEITKLKNQTCINTDELKQQSASLAQLVEYAHKVKRLEEEALDKDSEIAKLTDATQSLKEEIQDLSSKLREARLELGKKTNEEIDLDNRVTSLDVEKRSLQLELEASKQEVSKMESEMSNIVSKSKEETASLQTTITNLKKGKESLEETVEEMEGEIVKLKEIAKDGKIKLENDEDCEEALARIVNSIDMLAVLSKRDKELLEEYAEIVQMYNKEEGRRNQENSELLVDHLVNLGIVELMAFELKKHQMYPRGGGLGKYKIRQLKRGIAAELLEQYSESFYDV